MDSGERVDDAVNILTYPLPPAKGAITITTEDYKRLASNEYLNDKIIEFYLKYLHIEQLTEERKQKTHIFSTFFYNVLTNRASTSNRQSTAQERHEGVKKWIKDVNIFEKDFIVMPINHQLSHWFLAIICYPTLAMPNTAVNAERTSLYLSTFSPRFKRSRYSIF